MKRFLFVPLFLGCALAHSQVLYHVTDLGTLGGGFSYVTGVNSSGEVVGYSLLSDGVTRHAFIYSNGTMRDIGTLGGPQSFAEGINDSGQVVGQAYVNGAYLHAFLYSNGVMHDLGTLGGNNSNAFAISAAGQIVGNSDTTGGAASHAFLYSGSNMLDIGTLGGSQSTATGVNSSGQVVGYSYPPGDVAFHPFLYSNGVMQDIGTLGNGPAQAFGINDAGMVVGYSYETSQYQARAFAYSNGAMQDLGTLGGPNSGAYGINNSGQIVGFADVSTTSTFDAFIYSSGLMTGLSTILDSSSVGANFSEAFAIGNGGCIAVMGTARGSGPDEHALLLTPIAANVVLPSSYSLVVGTQSGGSLYSLQFSDSWYLTVQPGATTQLTEAPIQVQVSGTSPTLNPNSFQFTFAGHVNSINLSQSILLYNFATGAYETVSTTRSSLGSDSTTTITGTGNLARYVNQSIGEVRARVNFSRTGATSVIRWTASLGLANWVIQ